MEKMGHPTRTRLKRGLPFIVCLLLVLMILSAYSNTFTSPPYLDDFHIFIEVKAFYLRSLSLSSILSLCSFGWARFLPDVTFALNHYLGHSRLFYFHAVNILIHLLAFFAVLWFVSLLLAAEGISPAPGDNEAAFDPASGRTTGKEETWSLEGEFSVFFPLCVAAIWALSPVQTSAVTYLVQRIASMQALFFTLSAACFIKGRLLSGKKGRGAAVFFFLCVLAGLCAGLSKQNSTMLPVVLVVIDIWFFDSSWLKKGMDLWRKTGRKFRAFSTAALLGTFYYTLFMVLPNMLKGYATRDFTLTQRLLTEARVVVWYMSLMLWPVPSRLAMQHDPQICTSLFSPATTLPAILLIASLLFLAIRFRKKMPVITFGVIWFFLNLVIESTIIPLELVFEHRLYLPSIGFYLAVVALFTVLLRKASKGLSRTEFAKAACSLLLICASFFGIMTFLRNGVWKDTITIHYDTAVKAPENARANADFANTLCRIGLYDEGLEYAEKAINIGKNGQGANALAWNALVLGLEGKGETSEAIERAEALVKNDTAKGNDMDALPAFCANVANACISANRPEDAYKWTLRALRYIKLSDDCSLFKKSFVKAILLALFSHYDVDRVDPGLIPSVSPYLAARPPDAGGPKKACSQPAASIEEMHLKAVGVCRISMPAPGAKGDCAYPAVLTGMEFIAHGEKEYGRGILEREYAKHPDDPFVTAEIMKVRREDAQDLAQRKNWDELPEYVNHPYSRFNFDMAVAYLVQKNHLPGFFQRIGKNRLAAALKIHPGSRDARLLKAWYLYNENEAGEAVIYADKILAGAPKDSNAWLALGFFLAKAGDNQGALSAFQKVIELYPGYSHRTIVEELCSQLSKGKNIESASAGR